MVKQEKDILKVDLSKVKGSYTKELSDHIQEINSKYEDNSVNTNDYRELILNIIQPANNTPAKRNFIMKLLQKKTKCDILFYVTNSFLNGSKLGVI